MTPEERNVATLREANRLWHESKGTSIEHWASIAGDNVHIASIADGAPTAEFSRPRLSREDLRGYLTELTRDWSMNYHRMDDYIAQGNRVASSGKISWTHKKTGKTCTTIKVDIWTFDEEGRGIDFLEVYDTAALFAAATPDPA